MSCLWGELGVQEREEGRLHCTSFCNHGNLFKKIRKEGTSLAASGLKTVLPWPGTQVPSLVREVRLHTPCATTTEAMRNTCVTTQHNQINKFQWGSSAHTVFLGACEWRGETGKRCGKEQEG